MAFASPAVCAMRMFGIDGEHAPGLAVRLAKTIMDRFNTQEALVDEVRYGKSEHN